MHFIRHFLTRAVGAKQYTPTLAQLQASRTACRRTFATGSPNELADSRGTPYWLYGLVAAGAGSVLYLWRKGSQEAKENATQKIQEHHGAKAEYSETSEANR